MDRLECDRMFVAVVEARSFTGAAVELGTSSGQASKLVSRLEAELGVRLLNRTTRAVSETEAGRAYFERVRSILDEIDSLDLAIRNVAQTPRGRLRLTAPLTFGTVELARALNEFAAGYPEIELDVSFSDRVVNLVDEGFDVAVRVGRPADTSLIARKLCDVRIVLVGSDAYLAAHGEPSAPEDLQRHACIIDTNFREPGRWPFRSATGEPIAVPVDRPAALFQRRSLRGRGRGRTGSRLCAELRRRSRHCRWESPRAADPVRGRALRGSRALSTQPSPRGKGALADRPPRRQIPGQASLGGGLVTEPLLVGCNQASGRGANRPAALRHQPTRFCQGERMCTQGG